MRSVAAALVLSWACVSAFHPVAPPVAPVAVGGRWCAQPQRDGHDSHATAASRSATRRQLSVANDVAEEGPVDAVSSAPGAEAEETASHDAGGVGVAAAQPASSASVEEILVAAHEAAAARLVAEFELVQDSFPGDLGASRIVSRGAPAA